MPYCPKCDMEFIDGITVCSDCGGPLLESEEAAMKEQKEREKQEQIIEELQRRQSSEDASEAAPESVTAGRSVTPTGLYIKKEQRYEDLKSSASAFLIVGIVLLAVSVLFWSGIVKLPIADVSRLIFQTALTVLGIAALIVSISSTKSARELAPQIANENQKTKDLIQWFSDTYNAEAIDQSIEDTNGLSPEELSLKRFQIIQDYLITSHDLPDQSYVDMLSEEIYNNLYD